jgi:hypothetical protein
VISTKSSDAALRFEYTSRHEALQTPDRNGPRRQCRGEDLPPHPHHGRQPVWYNAETNVLGLELEPGCAEWVVFNPEGWPLKVHSLETNETLVYQISDKPCRQ